jgi:hypothetical protein
VGAFSPHCRHAAGTALRRCGERASLEQVRGNSGASGVVPVYLWTISGKPLVNFWYIPPVSSSCHGAGEGLQWMGWRAADLRARRKGEPNKVELAGELRSQTTMPLAWITERLNLGTRRSRFRSHRLRQPPPLLNSPQMIFGHYRELVRPADAEKWLAARLQLGTPNGANWCCIISPRDNTRTWVCTGKVCHPSTCSRVLRVEV